MLRRILSCLLALSLLLSLCAFAHAEEDNEELPNVSMVSDLSMETGINLLRCSLRFRDQRVLAYVQFSVDEALQPYQSSILFWLEGERVRAAQVIAQNVQFNILMRGTVEECETAVGYLCWCAQEVGILSPTLYIGQLKGDPLTTIDSMEKYDATWLTMNYSLADAVDVDSLRPLDYGEQLNRSYAYFSLTDGLYMPAQTWLMPHAEDGDRYRDLVNYLYASTVALSALSYTKYGTLDNQNLPYGVLIGHDTEGDELSVLSGTSYLTLLNSDSAATSYLVGWVRAELYAAGVPEESIGAYELLQTEAGLGLYQNGSEGQYDYDHTLFAFLDELTVP